MRSVRSLYKESLQLRPEQRNIGMICSVKPVLTEDLCRVQKEDIFNNMLYV
jgi:hypothetical protein